MDIFKIIGKDILTYIRNACILNHEQEINFKTRDMTLRLLEKQNGNEERCPKYHLPQKQ